LIWVVAGPWRNIMRLVVFIVAVLVLVTGAAGWYWHSASSTSFDYRIAAVKRGDVTFSVPATGTLEPDEVVDIGAQVAGQIESFGKDANGNSIDYRSPVEPNMVLARIDATVYKADVDVAQAQLEQAKTNILKGEADLAQAKSKLMQTEHNWNRAQTVGPSDALSQNDYDMYQADYESAKASVALANSEIAQAKDGVPLAQAELDKATRNLQFCTIVSPVKGVILDRRVNVGQTVVSSLNTPSLFLIGKDMTKMQIWASVNEADIGRIIPGAPVTFTCDTFPDKVFEAKVGKVRWNPTMNQNVVLYTVEVDVDNSSKVLIPYLTAKLQFEVAKDTDALLVPNLALRWVPATAAQVSPEARSKFKQADDTPAPAGDALHKARRATVWVKDGNFVRPVDVKVGVTDRVNTAVFGDDLKEGDQIVTGDVVASTATEKNPFMPPAQQRRR
jgi:HlyD family secretion protein